LTGKTVGIIGLGGIGTAVAKRLKGFKTNTIFYDIAKNKQINYPYAKFVSRNYLLSNSDIITLHCDLNDSSRNLINKNNLDIMKDDVIIINTARGEIVDLNALIDGIKVNKVGYAALDVYPEEPLPIYSNIRNSKNVLLGSHTACSSVEGQKKLAIKAINNLLKEIEN
jgi:phosphoglycerate dehydrogenase-like enzyme